MFCLRMFIVVYKNYIIYYNVYCYYMKSMCKPRFVLIGCCVSEAIYVPIIMYGLRLFIVRTTLFIKLPIP